MAEKISATDARQGRRGTQVLYVLIFALVLVALAWIGVELYGEAIEGGSTTAPGAVETAKPQQPATVQPQQPAQQ